RSYGDVRTAACAASQAPGVTGRYFSTNDGERSVTLENRIFALGGGVDAAAEIAGAEQLALALGLHRVRGPDLLDQGRPHGAADPLDGQRSGRGDLRGQAPRAVTHGARIDQPVEQSGGHGFGTFYPAAGVEEIESSLLTDHPRQRGRDAEALVDAEPGEVEPEPRGRLADAEVGAER